MQGLRGQTRNVTCGIGMSLINRLHVRRGSVSEIILISNHYASQLHVYSDNQNAEISAGLRCFNKWQLRNGGGLAFLSSFLSSAFGSLAKLTTFDFATAQATDRWVQCRYLS